jgi:hypothetical protein
MQKSWRHPPPSTTFREPLPVLCLQVASSAFFQCPSLLILSSLFLDYYQDEKAFLARVEEDATTFRPTGQMIYTYTRPTPHSSANSKGKGVAQPQTLDPESQDAVVFEVYHVRFCIPIPLVGY